MDAPSALEHDLLHHRDFLLRLARGLVGRDDAEDLVQDVFTRALRHPHDARARSWLASVARHLAVNRFRARSRRERREREGARPEAERSELPELDERLAIGRRVAAAVAALDAPHREVILLRFSEGLAHAEIAGRLGIPIGTVRTRQQRALARLRERLDREHGGRAAWSVALTAYARSGALAPVAGGGALAPALAAAAIAIVAAGAWWLARPGTPESAVELAAAALEPASSAETASQEASIPSATAREALAAAPAAARGLRHVVVGRVEGLSAAELRDARVEVAAGWKRLAIDSPALVAQPDADGAFELEVGELVRSSERWANPEPPDELVVVVEHPLHLREPATLAFERGTRDAAGDLFFDFGALAPRDAAVVRGRVRLPDGIPASGADAEAYRLDAGIPRGTSAARTACDADGRFDLRLDTGGEVAVVGLVEGVRPGHAMARLALGHAVDLGEVRLEAGAVIAGRVIAARGPVPLADVSVVRDARGPAIQRAGDSIAWSGGRFEWSSLWLQAGEDGRFEGAGLAPGAYRLLSKSLGRTTGALGGRYAEMRVEAPARDVRLAFSGALVRLVRSPDAPDDLTGRIHVLQDGAPRAALHYRSASDPNANTFVAPPDTPLALEVELHGLEPIRLELVTPGAGEELVHTLDYRAPGELATLELEWERDPRLDVEALRVYFETPEGAERFERGFHGAELTDGVLRMSALAPGRHRVRIHAGWSHLEHAPALDRVLEVELRPGETARERFAFELGGILEVDVRSPSGERVGARFVLLDAAGLPLDVRFHARSETTDFTETWLLEPWSVHRSEALPAGDYTLVLAGADERTLLAPDDPAAVRHAVRLVAGETTALSVTLGS